MRLVGGVLLTLGAAGMALAWVGGPDALADERVDRVEIGMRYSAFTRTEMVVPVGVPVTVVLVNDDPIDHEWMVGDAGFHDRHRDRHRAGPRDPRRGVSVPAGTSRTTTVTFRQPGEYLFVCHLPGHEAYGMVGVVRVVASGS